MKHEDIEPERARIRAIVDSAKTTLFLDANDKPYVKYACYVDGKLRSAIVRKLLGVNHTEALGDMVKAREMVINRVTESICRELHPEWDELTWTENLPRNTTCLK